MEFNESQPVQYLACSVVLARLCFGGKIEDFLKRVEFHHDANRYLINSNSAQRDQGTALAKSRQCDFRPCLVFRFILCDFCKDRVVHAVVQQKVFLGRLLDVLGNY